MTDLSIPLSVVALFISVVAILINLSVGRGFKRRLNSFTDNAYFSFLNFIRWLPDWMVIFLTIILWAILMFLFMGLIVYIQWPWF